MGGLGIAENVVFLDIRSEVKHMCEAALRCPSLRASCNPSNAKRNLKHRSSLSHTHTHIYIYIYRTPCMPTHTHTDKRTYIETTNTQVLKESSAGCTRISDSASLASSCSRWYMKSLAERMGWRWAPSETRRERFLIYPKPQSGGP